MKKHLLTNSKNWGITKLNSNAFTLIELLAIIVILAIIAVITVPIILNIIENSRKGAAGDSALGYKDSVNKYYLGKLAEDSSYTMPNGTYTVNGTTGSLTLDGSNPAITLNVQVAGTIPSSGELTYENNVLTEGWLVIGDYKVTFNSNGTVTTVKNTGSSSGGQGGTPSNPYLTTLNGSFVYDWDTGAYTNEGYEYYEYDNELWYTTLNSDAIVYLRKDNSTNTKEACGTFSDETICLTSSYCNSNYSSAGSYQSDFVDAINGEYDLTNIDTSGLKGYAKAKAVEMLSKGASSCNVNDSILHCSYDSAGYCDVYIDQVSCNDNTGVDCLVDYEDHFYCSH